MSEIDNIINKAKLCNRLKDICDLDGLLLGQIINTKGNDFIVCIDNNAEKFVINDKFGMNRMHRYLTPCENVKFYGGLSFVDGYKLFMNQWFNLLDLTELNTSNIEVGFKMFFNSKIRNFKSNIIVLSEPNKCNNMFEGAKLGGDLDIMLNAAEIHKGFTTENMFYNLDCYSITIRFYNENELTDNIIAYTVHLLYESSVKKIKTTNKQLYDYFQKPYLKCITRGRTIELI